MSGIFDDLEGVEVVMDDILVWGETVEQHDERLERVLLRAKENNIKFNRSKCKFRVNEVSYLGHLLTENGVKVDPGKVLCIQNIETPNNVKSLQRFLGMVTYLSRFIPNFSQAAAPLRELLEKDVGWHWEAQHEESFNSLKLSLTRAPVLKYFDLKSPICLSVDASSYGLGATLIQSGRPISYAGRSLTKSEKNYAQIEKEMLAIVFGCKKFHHYLYGQRIIHVESDHKPLESILKKPIHCAPPRLQRMILAIQPYPVEVTYKAGKLMFIADALSRIQFENEAQETYFSDDDFTISVVETGRVSSNVYSRLKEETKSDPEMQQLVSAVLHGWSEDKTVRNSLVKPYWNFRDEIGFEDGLLYKGESIIIPPKMRSEIMDRIHYSHLGIEKSKARARGSVFWPGINAQIEKVVADCDVCLRYRNNKRKEPMIPHPVPDGPWLTVAADLFYFDGRDYLLVVDYFSKYPELCRLPDKTAPSVIRAMKEIFARNGIPEKLISDNMPFGSREFRKFCLDWEVEHVTSSPRYPQSNGLVERNVQTIKRLLKKAKYSSNDSFLSLLDFRNTPISGMTVSPAELLMSRKLRTRLPSMKNHRKQVHTETKMY